MPIDVSVGADHLDVTVSPIVDVVVSAAPQGVAGRDGISPSAQSAETDDDCLTGQPLYIKLNGHLGLAQANSQATSRVCGLAIEDTQSGHSAEYIGFDAVERSDWSAITGSVALTIGAIYFLSPDSPGHLTTTAPSQSGQSVVLIGLATTETKLVIEMQPPILL